MLIETEFDCGTIVYLKTDPEQYARIVTGMNIRGTEKSVVYLVSFIASETEHYSYELSKEKDPLKNL